MVKNKREIVGTLKQLQPYFHQLFGIEFIGLFGSFSRGEQTEKSDIDILYRIDRDRKLSLFNYLKVISRLEEVFHQKIDLVRVDTLKPEMKAYIDRDLIRV